ncbi:Predicted oxidoreductase [Actinokineospora alba]|uniref:Predicted oxidoreductase n=1 Tax=Actinokineospora alba TaxID=504798 RepID=A0A1H0GJ76_9PSEU|nr:aldo/keto reductase [Actinokineospora alba]TDP69914.1 aryl-alcohol dehydrogenase-like predicted oxidoreductase [Actinokineospora alba]SDI06031.1 Predicted oxidoreductase [Actinokineospora alba]SDO06799.1 Predicted oxidoreductase [Actinokineospora alba]
MRFTLGLAALGRPAYLNLGRDLPTHRDVETLRSTTWDVLDAAYTAGVRRVDTARSYGRAEEFLAGWLDVRGHEDVTVSSKWGYTYVGDWRMDAKVHEVKEHTLSRFRSQWSETRALLGSRVALYQVHSLTVDSPLFTDEPLLDALAELADSGQRLGFSTSGPAQAEAVRRGLALERGGVTIFTAVQSTWNLLEPSAAPALTEAHAAGAHVAIKEALANGRLAVTPPADLAAHPEPPDAVALAAALAQPWADAVLIGPVTTAQLTSNLRAADLDPPNLPDLSEPPTEYWATRSHLPWT